jgi:hypothetical protein
MSTLTVPFKMHLCQLLEDLIEIINSSEATEGSGNKRSHAEMKKKNNKEMMLAKKLF